METCPPPFGFLVFAVTVTRRYPSHAGVFFSFMNNREPTCFLTLHCFVKLRLFESSEVKEVWVNTVGGVRKCEPAVSHPHPHTAGSLWWTDALSLWSSEWNRVTPRWLLEPFPQREKAGWVVSSSARRLALISLGDIEREAAASFHKRKLLYKYCCLKGLAPKLENVL